jgi:hypothetical protein
MKTYGAIIVILDAAVGLAAAVILLLWAGGHVDSKTFAGVDPAASWAGLRTSTLLLAALLLAANVLMLFFALRLLRGQTIQMPIDGGHVSISLSAVEQSLARTACALPDVRDVRIRVFQGRRDPADMRIYAEFTAWEGTAVKEVTRRLQEVLRMRILDILGGDLPLRFNIKLVGIALKETKKTEEKTRKEKNRKEQPYGGPVYPIDGPL